MRCNVMKSLKLLLLVWSFLLFIHYPAQAAIITGGSILLDLTDAGQLQTWLGEGDITLTNIFSSIPGDGLTSLDFHSAVDGQGRTFTVLSVTSDNYTTPILFGGYNPQSWDATSEGYVVTNSDADRTAFLFNLSENHKWDQHLSSDTLGTEGSYQTVDSTNYGPTFGVGHDIHVNTDLQFAYSYPASYGPYTYLDKGLDGITGLSYFETKYGENWSTTIEVFSISPVPLPATILLLGSGLIGVVGLRKKFKK